MVDNKDNFNDNNYNSNGNYVDSSQPFDTINTEDLLNAAVSADYQIMDSQETYNCIQGLIDSQPNQNFELESNQSNSLHQGLYQPDAMSSTPFIKQENQAIPEHWKEFPNLSEVQGTCEFEILVNPHCLSNCTYSPELKKIFIKINTVLNLEVSYSCKDLLGSKMFLRAMIVYPEFLYKPVVRCNNHKVNNKVEDASKDAHIIRCPHNNVEYLGTETGATFNERLALRFPLSVNNLEGDRVKNAVMLEFSCQNSCPTGINRRATVLLLTLEDEHGFVFGQQVLNFKVCTVPKRDRVHEETHPDKKRKSTGTGGPSSSKKPCVYATPESAEAVSVKVENQQSTTTAGPVTGAAVQVERVSSGRLDRGSNGVLVSLQMPDASLARDLVYQAHNLIAGRMVDDPENGQRYAKFLKNVKKVQQSLHPDKNV